MTTNSQHPPQGDSQRVARHRRWSWFLVPGADSVAWRLEWSDTSHRARHLQFVDELPDELYPWDARSKGDVALIVEPDGARPWVSFSLDEAPRATVAGLFTSLGKYLRHLHDRPSPEGFGPPGTERFRHTFNSFMTAEFETMNRHLLTLKDTDQRREAIDGLASLRQELSAFHPHGRSVWTVGRLTPTRLAVHRHPTRLAGCLDFGDVALRPPEFDLASLRCCGLLGDEQILADRAFWKGYGAALTRDLERRISYFCRLIELKRRLTLPSARRP